MAAAAVDERKIFMKRHSPSPSFRFLCAAVALCAALRFNSVATQSAGFLARQKQADPEVARLLPQLTLEE